MEVDNIKIRQTWIEEETEVVAKDLKVSDDEAFLYLSISNLLECSVDDIAPEDIVDGGHDKQIDFIHIEDDTSNGNAEITIAQCKNSNGFGSTTVVQMKNGLDWIFEVPKKQLSELKNQDFVNKIIEIRELRQAYGAGNLNVSVYHITNGDKTQLSDEYLSEEKKIKQKYENLGFREFKFSQIGAHELVELLNYHTKSKRKINVDIPIIYDVNRPSLINFSQGDTKSYVCTVSGKELAIAASSEPRDAIFDLNVRPYYGSRGKVNKEIWDTCTSDQSARFWFLNNGVTMVCDSFDFNSDPDLPCVKLTNAQIVNGCQTTVTLREAYEKQLLQEDTKVLLKIYATDNPNLVERITLTTNNQNKITDRDLRANDPVQRDIEQLMLDKYGYFYERKNKQYSNLRGPDKKKVVNSPKAAQAYLAIVKFKPANARGYLSAIWSDHYLEIFEKTSVADLLASFKIHQYCHSRALEARRNSDISGVERDCSVYGIFQIARTMGFILTEDKWGHGNLESIEKLLQDMESEKLLMDSYDQALKIVVNLREKDSKEYKVPAMYFKNGISQRKLNAELKSTTN
ncbi:MAG: hypothetical protein CML06_17940 [Pseudomonadales bacterium]|nr:hypothetical protein [Pseudomonadales bacterium]